MLLAFAIFSKPGAGLPVVIRNNYWTGRADKAFLAEIEIPEGL